MPRAGRLGDALLAARVVIVYAGVRRDLRHRPLSELAAGLQLRDAAKQPVGRLSRAVTKVLGVSVGDRARCIHRAVVLQRLLARQGTPSVLVIGLPPGTTDVKAHAWVEVGGQDAGPAPGRGVHEPMARYAVPA